MLKFLLDGCFRGQITNHFLTQYETTNPSMAHHPTRHGTWLPPFQAMAHQNNAGRVKLWTCTVCYVWWGPKSLASLVEMAKKLGFVERYIYIYIDT